MIEKIWPQVNRNELSPPNRVLLLFLLAVCWYLGGHIEGSEAPKVSDQAAFLTQDWTKILHDTSLEFVAHEIPAVQQAMFDIQAVTRGESVSWPECPGVELSVTFIPDSPIRRSLMSLQDNFSVQIDPASKTTAIHVTWAISLHQWGLWEAQRAEGLWHELFHVRQICALAVQLSQDLSSESATKELHQLVREHIAEMESEVIGTQAYWSLQTDDRDFDMLLKGQVLVGSPYTLLDIWQFFFSTSDLRPWTGIEGLVIADTGLQRSIVLPEHSDGRPNMEDHPNWPAWTEAIDELYVRKFVRPGE